MNKVLNDELRVAIKKKMPDMVADIMNTKYTPISARPRVCRSILSNGAA